MKEKYIRYLEKENKYLVSIRTRKYTLFSKRTETMEEAIEARNKFLIDKFGNLNSLYRKNVPEQNIPNKFTFDYEKQCCTGTDSNGNEFIIDIDEFPKVSKFTWIKNQYGYFQNPKAGKLHRFILNAEKGKEVDHLNRDKSDNRKCNLRIATISENRQNRDKLNTKRDSKYKGVFRIKKYNKYFCEISKDKTLYKSKMFDTEEEAALEYNNMALKLYGDKAFQNVIQD